MGTIWIQIDSLVCLGFRDLSVADELYASVYITSDNVSLFHSESSKERLVMWTDMERDNWT